MNKNKDKLVVSIKKAKSSLEKIMKMIEEDKYCINILQQNLAVIGLLKSANMQILEAHIECCIKTALNKNDKKEVDTKMQELIKVFKLGQNK